MASLMDILAGAGNLLDLPGSSLRDLLSGRNPFDQWATPFSDVNRASGRDVLQPFLGANEETGMSGWMDNPMEGFKDIAGFGAEVLLDPLNLVPLGAVGKALKGRKAVRSANAAMKAERGGKYAYVNPKVAGRVASEANPMTQVLPQLEMDRYRLLRKAREESPLVDSDLAELGLDYLTVEGYGPQFDELTQQIDTLRSQNPMKLLGYTPERPVVYHGGHDWSASATPENPYGMFDVNRLRTGEGGNMYGPGAYFAEAESTSRNYQDMVRSKLTRGLVDDPELLSEYFTPGRVVSSYSGQDQVVGFSPTGARRPGASGWTVQVRSILPGHTAENPRLGPLRTHSTSPNMSEVYAALGRKPPEARLYQLDMPPEAADRFVSWENPMNQQPVGVQDAIKERVPGFEDLATEYVGVWDQLGRAKTEMRRLKSYNPDYLDTPEGMRWLAAATQARNAQRSIVDDIARQTSLSPYDAEKLLEDPDSLTGGSIARILLGDSPQTASMSNAASLPQLGVSGSKNLANSTGRSTYNYAIWDQDLLNKMRIRAIDGQRVPINPTTLVEQVQQPLPRAADSPLVSTMNPMQLQPEPSPFPAAVAGAVYNALQAFNDRGGIQ